MNRIRLLVTRHPLIAFFVLAYSCTWLSVFGVNTIYADTTLTFFLALPFLLLSPGPLYAAIIVTALTSGKAGVKSLLRKFIQWRVGWRWYAVALLLAPAIGLSAVYLNVLFGAPNPTAALLSSLPSLLLAFAIRLVDPTNGPMMEELGWRGYAQPQLQQRHSALTANLILGAVVAGWHLPFVLSGDLPVFALLGTVAATLLFGWIFNNTQGSVLLTLIAHAADGLIRTSNLGWAEADSTRYLVLLVAVWCVTALLMVVRYGPTLVRKPAAQVVTTPVAQPLPAK